MPRLTDNERSMFDQFIYDYPLCWACGTFPGDPCRDNIDYPRHLERHHIIGGAGRKHDRRNISSLCKLCHDLLHGATIKQKGGLLIPNLNLGNLLWLKNRHDGPLDRKYLAKIKQVHSLPRCRKPNHFISNLYTNRHG